MAAPTSILLPEQYNRQLSVFVEATLEEMREVIIPPLQGRLGLVADLNTWGAMGERLFNLLKPARDIVPVIFPFTPTASDVVAGMLLAEIEDCDMLVAVGSGTINDLCKHVAFEQDIPYVVFPTALSVNGYASANASLTVDGSKQTFPARMPRAIFIDLETCKKAPETMTNAGLADVLCRSTAQADWLLSHLLLDTPYDEKPFRWLYPHEKVLLNPESEEIIRTLAHAIILSGLGMTHAGGSYPASQGEHMIVHTYEMKHESMALHGAAVGVAALTMSRLQHELLSDAPVFSSPKNYREEIESYFGKELRDKLCKSYEAKLRKCRTLKNTIPGQWETVRKKMQKIMLPAERLETALKAAGAPLTPEALGWKKKDFDAALRHAKYVRDRFTFLDLLP